MRLLALDFETTGVNPNQCEITEFAWALYDTKYGKSPVVSRCYLNKDITEIDPGAQKVTGITPERCQEYGFSLDSIEQIFSTDMDALEPDFLVAHNAHSFDKTILERWLPIYKDKKWIDTMYDLPEELYQSLGTKKLEFMAARLGFLNPFPHAALPDVMTMMKILMDQDVERVCEASLIPNIIIKAKVTFEGKELAKERGFRWQRVGAHEVPKSWIKMIKKDKLEEEINHSAFNVEVVQEVFK